MYLPPRPEVPRKPSREYNVAQRTSQRLPSPVDSYPLRTPGNRNEVMSPKVPDETSFLPCTPNCFQTPGHWGPKEDKDFKHYKLRNIYYCVSQELRDKGQ